VNWEDGGRGKSHHSEEEQHGGLDVVQFSSEHLLACQPSHGIGT
jgi:hypothetical protein